MPTPDEAAEVYARRLLDEAPPLPSDLAALIVHAFAETTPEVSEAA